MSKVFLLNCNTTIEPYPVYPLGMSLVAAALEQAGHQVRQFDLLATRQDPAALDQAIRRFQPQVLGLSLRNIDNVDSQAEGDHWYLGQVKSLMPLLRLAAPGATVVLGGPAFSIMPEVILDFLHADHGVVGSGETALPRLVAALETGERPPRLVRATPQVHSDGAWPRPAVVPEIMAHYLRESGLANLQTRRGCPFRCCYCTYPLLEGRSLVFRDPKEVAEDVAWLHREHGVTELFFTDSVFNDPGGRYLEIAESLLRLTLPVRWAAFFRPQHIGVEEARLLKRSGCMAVELGTDAACDATLAGLDKGFDFAQVLRCNEALRAAELPAAHFVIFGGPNETMQTLELGLENLRSLGNAPVFAFSGIRILPGTPLHFRAVQEGVLQADASLLRPVYYFSPQVDPEALNARLTQAFAGERLRFFPPREGQLRLDVMRRFGFRGLLWDRLPQQPVRAPDTGPKPKTRDRV